ncbi:MAG: rhomboid family intramembrane serine protease [Lachnospiraceae bacterium]|nr:rhomboid family intramembrane serine protease [Lachnospiraceae bacterium]
MMKHMKEFLTSQGYQFLPSNLPEFMVYYRNHNNVMEVIHVMNTSEKIEVTPQQASQIKNKIVQLFQNRGYQNIHMLTLILNGQLSWTKLLAQEDDCCWILDETEKRLLIYENQKPCFSEIKTGIESYLQSEKENQELSEPVVKNISSKSKVNIYQNFKNRKTQITDGITILNVILFLICILTGDILYQLGSINAIRFFYNHEYYRIFTAMFLHGDIQHLIGNMLMFFFLGEIVENKLGYLRYLTLYLGAGICGGLLSMAYSTYLQTFTDSIGASGAIFGVIGALLWIVLRNKGKVENITLGKIMFLAIYSLYSGFISTNVDNAAHIGGFIAGIVIAAALYRKNTQPGQKEETLHGNES